MPPKAASADAKANANNLAAAMLISDAATFIRSSAINRRPLRHALHYQQNNCEESHPQNEDSVSLRMPNRTDLESK